MDTTAAGATESGPGDLKRKRDADDPDGVDGVNPLKKGRGEPEKTNGHAVDVEDAADGPIVLED